MVSKIITVAALVAALTGCANSPATVHKMFDRDCIAQAKGDKDKFDWCYSHAKSDLNDYLTSGATNPFIATELASIDAKLDAQKAAFYATLYK